MQIPNAARILIDTIKVNHEIYLVGGAVRDFCMNITPKDFDFTSNATPEQVIEMFRKTIKNGIKHGTIAVIINNQVFEVTTFRSTNASTLSIENDLSCRDFTINAMAWDFSCNRIIDPFHGQEDLENKQIKTVGAAIDRFKEDPHRVFRAARLASQLNFSISEEIFNTAPLFADRLGLISHERIYNEIIKIFCGINPEKALSFLHQTNSMQFLFINYLDPEINYNSDLSTIIEIFNTSRIKDPLQRISIYFFYIFKFDKHDSEKSLNDWLKDYKFPHKSIKLILKYIESFSLLKKNISSGYETRILLKIIGKLDWIFLYKWKKSENIIKGKSSDNNLLDVLNENVLLEKNKNPPLEISDLAVNGNELMIILKIQRGKLLGELLHFLLQEVLIKPENNTKENLIKLSRKFIQGLNRS